MTSKTILWPAFFLVVLAQLYVPAKMILHREVILDEGTAYKFRTEPIDPSDPFRGKYITLRFEEQMIAVQNEADWLRGETAYVSLTTGEDGFAKLQTVAKEKPTNGQDFLQAKVNYVTRDGSNLLMVEYPFDRYYMEESKAYAAELAYRESQLDTNQIAYALVLIKDGDSVLKDVLINDTPIKEVVARERSQQQ